MHDVIYGPVLKPGTNHRIDGRAWNTLAMLGGRAALPDLMLMHYEPSGHAGRLVAAFKRRDTRAYRRVSFCFSQPARDARTPRWEPERDCIALHRFIREVEECGVRSTALREALRLQENRVERLTGRTMVYG